MKHGRPAFMPLDQLRSRRALRMLPSLFMRSLLPDIEPSDPVPVLDELFMPLSVEDDPLRELDDDPVLRLVVLVPLVPVAP